jgi:hypothetical protein
MTNLGLGGYVEADIKDKLLAGEEKDDANALEIAKAAGHSLLHSAIQQPMSALVQIGAAASGKDFEAPELIATPQHAEFGTGKWYAQTIGAGAGMVMPFLASEAVVCRIGKAASHMGGAKLASTLESTALGAKVMPTLNPIGHSAASGAFYGLVFTPSSDTEANFISDRLKNATVSGVTFGAQRAATIGITAGTQKAWSSGMEAARKGTTDLGTMSRLSSLESALTHPALKATNRITANALGGAVAGAVHANAHAYMFEGRAATGQETWESVATFVVTGGALDAAHIVGGKIAERNAGRRAQSAPESKSTAGHSGKKFGRQRRLDRCTQALDGRCRARAGRRGEAEHADGGGSGYESDFAYQTNVAPRSRERVERISSHSRSP